jgi:hypothetical protein
MGSLGVARNRLIGELWMVTRRIALVMVLLTLLASFDADAGCCRLVKADPETSSTHIRACVPNSEGACGEILFEGTLELNDESEICSTSETILYQEFSTNEGVFGLPVSAQCNGGDVEL